MQLERREMKSDTWASHFLFFFFLKLLSSPAAPCEHQSSISICLTDTSYKIATWKRENLCLAVCGSTVNVCVCSLWCTSTTLSVSLCISVLQHWKNSSSILLSPLISSHPLPSSTSHSPVMSLHLSFTLLPFLLFSPPPYSSSPPSIFHLHSLSSLLHSMVVTDIFPWWKANAPLSSLCSCWSPASLNSRHQAKTVLLPPHHPTMNGLFLVIYSLTDFLIPQFCRIFTLRWFTVIISYRNKQ